MPAWPRLQLWKKAIKIAFMKFFVALIIIAFSTGAFAGPNRMIRQDIGRTEKYNEYKCIEEGRDKTWDELRTCVKEKKGKSLIYIEKHWEEDPAKRELRVQ